MNIESAVNILNNFLTKNKIFISDMELRKMIKFALKENEIDFEFLLKIFKERADKLDLYPKN